MMRYRACNFFVAVVTLMLIASCKKNSTTFFSPGVYTPPPAVLPEKILTNVAYGSHTLQQMDIYLPRDRSVVNTPMIILVHGGEWKAGDKSQMQGYIDYLKPQFPAFAFANVNYRLVQNGSFLFPAQEDDLRTAVNFLVNLSDSLKFSKKFGVIGESAGAQIGLLNAYKTGRPLFRAAVGFGAPSNLKEWYLNPPAAHVRPLLLEVTGGTPDQLPSVYYDASVINFVSSQSPATLIVHGASDGVIPTSYPQALAQKLNTSGSNAKLVIVNGEFHTFSPAGINILYSEIEQFLKTPNLFK